MDRSQTPRLRKPRMPWTGLAESAWALGRHGATLSHLFLSLSLYLSLFLCLSLSPISLLSLCFV